MSGVPIVRLAARGDGVSANGDYVPGAVPGDTLVGGDIEPGPHRAAPPCRHFRTCGGCQLQHVDDEVLADFAQGRIEAALRSAGVKAKRFAPTHLSPPAARRRASLRAQTHRGKLSLGFNEESSRTVVDIAECPVLTATLFALAQALREPLGAAMPSDWICGLTLTQTGAGADVLISNLTRDGALPAFSEEWMADNGVARISVEGGGRAEPLLQRAVPQVSFGGVPVELPPGAFLQATEDGETALVRAVMDYTQGSRRVADLFCGLGTFALPLAERSNVFAADAAHAPVLALKAAAGRSGRSLETAHRDLFRRPLSVKELAAFDAVVLDPPRAGAKAQCELLTRAKIPRIAYVSCNPSTFARDAATLHEGGFRLVEVRPVGQFRWSTHVELAASFER